MCLKLCGEGMHFDDNAIMAEKSCTVQASQVRGWPICCNRIAANRARVYVCMAACEALWCVESLLLYICDMPFMTYVCVPQRVAPSSMYICGAATRVWVK